MAGRFDVPERGVISVFLLFPAEDQSRFVQKRHRFFYPLSYLSTIRRVMDEIHDGDLSSLERWKMAKMTGGEILSPTIARLPSTREKIVGIDTDPILKRYRGRGRERGRVRRPIDHHLRSIPSRTNFVSFVFHYKEKRENPSNQFSKFPLYSTILFYIPRSRCSIEIGIQTGGEGRKIRWR